jgi:multidrug efflux system membrane fusion protein
MTGHALLIRAARSLLVGALAALLGAAAPESEAVPVTSAAARRADVAVTLDGIGTVRALYTVLIRARVDGYLDSVAFTEGQEVRRGDLLAIIDPRPYQAALDQSRAQQVKDQAALVAARLDLSRYAHLALNQFASRQSVDDQQALVDELNAAIKADAAAIENAALNLSFTHIVSPIDGRVGLRLVDPGNLVHATDSNGLVTVTQVHPITATFTLPEDDLAQVLAAMRAGAVPVRAFTADHRRELATGVLLTPNNSIDTGSGTITLKAQFANTDNHLWPGQFIDAHLQTTVLHDAVTVPEAAVQRGADGLFVFVIGADARVAIRPVEERLEQDGIAVIESGLRAGERVVVNGQSRLQDGTPVQAREEVSMATPPAAGTTR